VPHRVPALPADPGVAGPGRPRAPLRWQSSGSPSTAYLSWRDAR
jgi:hypothetical protein